MRSLIKYLLILSASGLLSFQASRSPNVPGDFIDPPREFSVMPFWFWNDTLRDEEIIRQIADMESHGVYGFVIHPRIGLPENVTWLGPEMIRTMHVAVKEAAKRKMYVVLYDEGMYPSGSSGGQVVGRNPEHAARGLAKIDLKEGEEPQLSAGQKLISVIRRPDGSRVAVVDQFSGGNIRGLHYISEGTERIREDSPPSGDILNPDAVTSFIELVYDKYAKEFGSYFGSTIIGIFTDEPSPLGRNSARGVIPGNAGIIPRINEILGYDITPHLADLWYNDHPDSRKHRIEYNRAVNICLEENYYRRLGNWCRDHGVALMGHPAGSMDIGAERYFQMPGQDLVWRYVEPGDKALKGEHSTMAKCASGAMVHLGKRRNTNELYGAYGHNLTFDEMKWLASWCFVRGQNFLIPHAFYYSIRGPRFDERPPDVGPNAAWWKDYKPYADACRRLSWLNTDSKQVCDIAVLGEATWLPWRIPEILFRNQRDFNYLEIRHLWEDAKTGPRGVHIAGMNYKVVIIDSLSSVPEEAKPALKTLAASGRLVIWNNDEYLSMFPGAEVVKTSAGLLSKTDRLIKPDIILSPASESIRYRHVEKEGIHYYILFNEENKKISTRINTQVKGRHFWLDPYSAGLSKYSAGKETVFEPHELKILAAASQPSANNPYGLMVEFIRQPSGVQITDLQPEFSWIVPPEAKKQTAYRILVAGSAERINSNCADVWDSGKIPGDRSVEVECGVPLNNSTGYFWKVMIWDAKGKPSGFSGIQYFKTGPAVSYLTTANKFESYLIPPVILEKTSGSGYFADFGKDAFGTLILNFSAPREDTLIIHLGEKLSGNRKIDRQPGGTVRYAKVAVHVSPGKKEYTVNLPRDTRNTTGAAVQLPDSFGIIMPFRYCEVENCPVELRSSDILQKIYHYYFEEGNSSFTSSDTVLNKIWDICKYSMKATSFAGIYIDGDRERIPYEADAYINQLGHYYTDREYSIARLTNEYFIEHPTWPTEWILHTVPMFYNDFMFTGNTESLRNYYAALRHKTLTSIAGDDGLISSKNVTAEIMKNLGFTDEKERIRDIVDWPPSQKDTGWKLATPEGERDGYDMVEVNTVVNAFYYNGLVRMAEIADRLGEREDADYYGREAEKVRKVFNEKLLNKSSGTYVDGTGSGHSSLHANMMALAFGLVPEEYKKTVTGFIKTRGMACSVYGAQYLLEGLYRAGEADYALELMTATHDRSWWNMIASGSTMTLEAWDMKYKPNLDWNHAWGAAPANIIPGYMWGIEPAEPGWRKALIRPQLSLLEHSKITVPTIRGNIVAEYNRKRNSGEYRITLPGNMECDFVTGNGVISLKPGINKFKF